MGRLFDHLIHWSITNRVIVLGLALVVALYGAWVTAHASLDVLPDFASPMVVVQTQAPGMAAAQVEQQVTQALERVLLGTPRVATVRSTSSPGLSVITATFEDSVDLYLARQLIAERLSEASRLLPASVEQPRLAPITPALGAILKLSLSSNAPDQAQAMRDLRTFADWTLKPRLLTIPGVSQITVQGGSVERLEVRPDPLRLSRLHLQLDDIAAAVAAAQAPATAGLVETLTTTRNVETALRLSLKDAPLDLARLPLRRSATGPLLLGDVSDIGLAAEPPVGAAIFDGKAAVYIQVNKLPGADTLGLTKTIERTLAELGLLLPAGGHIDAPIFRQADFIKTSLFSLGRSMIIGAALVVAVLIAFLRRGRLAFISLVSIPLAILAAITVLVHLGLSINGMTIGGLAIAIGEVVDDAIIDVENVWRRLRENTLVNPPRNPFDIISGASLEIRSSVVSATFIVVLVLVPVLLLGGIAGKIFAPLAWAYILALLSSLLVALTVTPAMCAWLLPRLASPDERPSRLALWLLAFYSRCLRRATSRPKVVLGAAAVAAAVAAVALPFLGGRFLPDFREGTLIAHLQALPGVSLAETTRLARMVDAQLRPGEAIHTLTKIGRAELDEDAAPISYAEMSIRLPPDDPRDAEDLTGAIQTKMGRVAGLSFTVDAFLSERVNEILSGETAPVVVKVYGRDLSTLRRLAAEVATLMSNIEQFSAVRSEPQIDVADLRIEPKRDEMAKLGMRPLQLASDLVTWRWGRKAGEIIGDDGRITNLTVVGAEPWRREEALGSLPIGLGAAGFVPLAAVAKIVRSPAPVSIKHDGGERRLVIGAEAAGSGLSGAVSELKSRLAKELKLPSGYHIEVGGQAVARSEAVTRLALIGLLVLVAVFMFLVFAFSSLKDAAIVLLNLPLGMVGGVLGAAFLPDGVSVAGLVGFVTLSGIISRNGIMLVTHRQAVARENPAMNAVDVTLKAAEERLLPIIMTATTAGLGLLPLAVSVDTAGSELEGPMALIVVCGLLTSTILNMIVLPTLYVWLARRGTTTLTPKGTHP